MSYVMILGIIGRSGAAFAHVASLLLNRSYRPTLYLRLWTLGCAASNQNGFGLDLVSARVVRI